MFFHGSCPSPPPPPDTTRELAIASLGALIGALLTLILVVALKPRTSSPAEAAALVARNAAVVGRGKPDNGLDTDSPVEHRGTFHFTEKRVFKDWDSVPGSTVPGLT